MGTTYIDTSPAAVYGRKAGGAEAARDEWWKQMDNNDADHSATVGGMGYANGQSANPTGVGAEENRGLANNEASGANGHQGGAIGLAGTLARGQQPSVAAYSLQNNLNQGVAQQKSFAAGARGGAAIATAGQDSRANIANQQQNAYAQGGILKSREMAAGRGMLGTMLEQQRGQDNQRLGQANEFGASNADLRDRAALGFGQAAVGLGNVANAQNQQDQQYYNSGMGPIDAQSEAEQAHQNWLVQHRKQAVAANEQDHSSAGPG